MDTWTVRGPAAGPAPAALAPPKYLPDQAVEEVTRTLAEAQAALGPDHALELTLPADGFVVRSLRPRGPLLELRGLTAQGVHATRLVHPHQLDLQIVFVQAAVRPPHRPE